MGFRNMQAGKVRKSRIKYAKWSKKCKERRKVVTWLCNFLGFECQAFDISCTEWWPEKILWNPRWEDHIIQRSYQRWLDKRICKTKMKFWAVLGSRAAEKKTPPNCHKYAAFWGVFLNFLRAFFFFFNFLKIF